MMAGVLMKQSVAAKIRCICQLIRHGLEGVDVRVHGAKKSSYLAVQSLFGGLMITMPGAVSGMKMRLEEPYRVIAWS